MALCFFLLYLQLITVSEFLGTFSTHEGSLTSVTSEMTVPITPTHPLTKGKIFFAFLDVSDHLELKKRRKKVEFDPRRLKGRKVENSTFL